MFSVSIKVLILSTIIVIGGFLVNFILLKNKNVKSFLLGFECGFDMILWETPKMSIHFFKIGIIFIMFDLELMFLLFLIKNFVYYKLSALIHFFIVSTCILESFNMLFKWSF